MKKVVKGKSVVKEKQQPGAGSDWQIGPYTRQAEFRFVLPVPFLMLCKLLEITPEQLLIDFMDDLSCGNWNREGRDEAKKHLINYFIAHGYAKDRLRQEDALKMFSELDAIGKVWPEHAEMGLLELAAQWRDAYQEYWFNKWMKLAGSAI